jgi:predicted nucleic acid-binding protein
MATFLRDTTVIIDAINCKRGRDRLLDGMLEQGSLLACCCINVTEVYAGMRPHEAKATEALLGSLDFYNVTWEIARRAGELKREWANRGHTIAVPDITIAAVALAYDLTLVTDNRKHFPMPELKFLRLEQ